jgi:hypothetical protein
MKASPIGPCLRLDEFQRNRAADRSISSKPLRRVITAEQAAESALADAQAAHHEYLSRLDQVEELRGWAHEAQQTVMVHEAAAALYAAAQLADREWGAERVDAHFGSVQPANVADDDQIAHEVSKAVASWRSVPAPAAKPQRCAADIEKEIAALPTAPDVADRDPPEPRRERVQVTRQCRCRAALVSRRTDARLDAAYASVDLIRRPQRRHVAQAEIYLPARPHPDSVTLTTPVSVATAASTRSATAALRPPQQPCSGSSPLPVADFTMAIST